MAVGVPWLEFQSGLGPGVQDPGVDARKIPKGKRGIKEPGWRRSEARAMKLNEDV